MLEEISLIADVRSEVSARLTEPWKYCTSKALTITQLDEFSGPTIGLLARGKRCLLYTSDAADEEDSVDLGGRRIIEKIICFKLFI